MLLLLSLPCIIFHLSARDLLLQMHMLLALALYDHYYICHLGHIRCWHIFISSSYVFICRQIFFLQLNKTQAWFWIQSSIKLFVIQSKNFSFCCAFDMWNSSSQKLKGREVTWKKICRKPAGRRMELNLCFRYLGEYFVNIKCGKGKNDIFRRIRTKKCEFRDIRL